MSDFINEIQKLELTSGATVSSTYKKKAKKTPEIPDDLLDSDISPKDAKKIIEAALKLDS